MKKRSQSFVSLARVEKDKTGKSIPIYKITRVEKSKLTHDIDTGKREIKRVKL